MKDRIEKASSLEELQELQNANVKLLDDMELDITSLEQQKATLAPASDKASAIAKPIPWDAPVTNATLPFKEKESRIFIVSLD